MELFNSLTFKPEFKSTFEAIFKPFIENAKNIFIKSEPFSGVMKSIGKVVGDMGYKLYEYDFTHLEEERWEDELRNHFGMISRDEKMIVLFKNFGDLENNLYNFLWTTNSFTGLDCSFIIVSDTNQENKEYVRRSSQVDNADFYYLLGIDSKFIDYSINKFNTDKYDGKIDSGIIKKELKDSEAFVQYE